MRRIHEVKSIFLVASPLQVLNAAEARHYFAVPNDDATLIVFDNPKYHRRMSDTQIDSAIQVTAWSQVQRVTAPTSLLGPLAQIAWYKKVLSISESQRQTADHHSFTFIGNYEAPAMLHVANVVAAENNVLLDDGTLSISVATRRKENQHLLALESPPRRWLYNAIGLNTTRYRKVTFFSAFGLNVGPHDDYALCDYELLRSWLPQAPDSAYSVFLGNPIVELDIVSDSAYYSGLRRAISESYPQPIKYIAHRREDEKKLLAIKQELGLEITQPSMPFELALVTGTLTPNRIFSFYSSALITSAHILQTKGQVVALRLQDREISPSHRAAISEIYSTIASNQRIRLIS